MKKKILILVSILVVFLAIPPFVNYWVSTTSPIGFIPIEKQEVWISFYASLIGSGITLLGVALTICYTDFTRKEDFRKHEQELKEEYEKRNNDTKINLSAQYKPILTVTFDSNYIDDIKFGMSKRPKFYINTYDKMNEEANKLLYVIASRAKKEYIYSQKKEDVIGIMVCDSTSTRFQQSSCSKIIELNMMYNRCVYNEYYDSSIIGYSL